MPANMPMQGPGQQGMGGLMQGKGGNMAMGALGGAAAVIGGEMLLHGIERDLGGGERRHHRRDDDDDGGMFGGLGEIANDLGLF